MSRLSAYLWEVVTATPRHPSFNTLQETYKSAIKNVNSNLPIMINQGEIIQQRSLIPRKDKLVPKSDYLQFLRWLYPDTKYVHFKSLLRSYKKLPEPQPLFINQYHLEHMIQQFMKVSAGDSTKEISLFYKQFIEDMRKAGMSVSWKEENSSSFMTLNSYTKIESVFIEYFRVTKNRMKEFGHVDTSTMNMFLKHAVNFGDAKLLKQINKDFTKYGVKPSRVSFELLLRYAVSKNDQDSIIEVLNAMVSEGFAIDITVINNCLKSLVNNNELDITYKIIEILESNITDENFLNLDSKHSKRIYMNFMNSLDSLDLKPNQSLLFPAVPVYETYQPIINHHIELKNFNPDLLLKTLNKLIKHKIQIPNTVFVNIFNVLKSHTLSNSNLDKFLNIYKLQIGNHVKYDHKMFDLILASHLRQNQLASKAIRNQSLDLGTKYRKIELLSRMRPWSVVDINSMISDYIDDVAVQ